MKSNVLLWCKPVYKDHVFKLPEWYEKFILLNQVGTVIETLHTRYKILSLL